MDNDSLLRFRNHGIVIVYDINEVESFNNVKQWLKKIDRYACEIVPKLLVGNKLDADGEGKREVPYEMAKEFADDAQMDFIEVSAKDGTNVDECFLKLAENIMVFIFFSFIFLFPFLFLSFLLSQESFS